MARPPVTPVTVLPTGAYDAVRSSPAQGGCGIHGYPCRHPGEDLTARKGTPVAAPHDGWVLVSKATDKAPFAGYGPSVVLLAHDDSPDSWTQDLFRRLPPLMGRTRKAFRYSLLAHLDPSTLTYDVDLAAAVMDRSNYDVLDDGTWAMLWSPATYVKEGEVLGYVGDAGHVHWEVRISPLGTHSEGATEDPFGWLQAYDALTAWGITTLPVDASKAKRPPAAGASWWPLAALLGAGWLASRSRRRRRGRARGRAWRRR